MMKTYLEFDEVTKMEQAAEYLRDRLLVRLLFRLGCRVSEALGVAVTDVDFGRKLITIQHLKTRVRLACPGCGARLSRASKFCPGCGVRVEKAVASELERRRQRALPVDDDTLGMIREYVKGGGPVRSKGRALLFGINRHRAWQVVRECAAGAGLGPLTNAETGKARGVSPHRLRDAFAVNAVKKDDSGDGLRLLQEHLGHQSFNTTAKYRKVSGEEHQEWYEKLWELPKAE
jgi:integrase/recombinase XerD